MVFFVAGCAIEPNPSPAADGADPANLTGGDSGDDFDEGSGDGAGGVTGGGDDGMAEDAAAAPPDDTAEPPPKDACGPEQADVEAEDPDSSCGN
jgi:hypothetical protein